MLINVSLIDSLNRSFPGTFDRIVLNFDSWLFLYIYMLEVATISVIFLIKHLLQLNMSFSMENQKNKSSILVLFSWIFVAAAMAAENTTTVPVKVGVVVDLDEPTGKMYLSCIKMALSDFYDSNAHYKTRVNLTARNSNEDVVGAADAGFPLKLSDACSYNFSLLPYTLHPKSIQSLYF